MILRLRYCVSQWQSVTVDATVEGGYIYKVDRCCGAQPSQHRAPCLLIVASSASKSSIRRFVITEKAPTRAFSWLKAATTAFTSKTLLRHYAKQAFTPRFLNVKLGPRRG